MQLNEDKLKELLLDSGVISKTDLARVDKEALKKKVPFSEVLVNEGKIAPDELARLEAYVLGIPFVDLKSEKIDFSVLSLIPEPIARTHNIVAFKKSGEDLEVATLNPKDLEAIEFIKKKLGLRILPRLTDAESIRKILLQYQKSLKAEFGDIIAKEVAPLKTISLGKDGEALEKGGDSDKTEDLEKLASDLPVVRIVDTLLNHAILQQASDIHIEPLEKDLLIRYRIDGILHDAMVLPKNAAPGITARVKVLASLRLDEKRLPQDGRFKIDMSNQRVSFRVSTLPTYFGEKTVMRLLPETSRGFTLEVLGFYGEGLEHLHRAIKKTTGMILVTGPTGSGKTTTLYTVLDILNTPDVNISTVEDPIEYQVARINQTQVRPEIGLTFASGLRTLLRQDPDILMVGEIRDKETVQLAINASLTGHLVLSTLHTNSAAGAIPRLEDMGAEAFLLTSTINIIIAQRLVRRLTDTKVEYKITDEMLKELGQSANLDLVLETLKKEKIVDKNASWKSIPFYKPKGGDGAEGGYAGRLGIHEILAMSPAIMSMVEKRATSEEIQTQARKEGMLTMIEDGIVKAVQGITSIEEVFRVANN
ncbi:MAG TPA: ATPase, T2SS/T4P/T4SS family [Candidatus Paceibacterota bacterium]